MKDKRHSGLFMLEVSLLFYVLTYGFFRCSHLYVHYTGTYKDGMCHAIGPGRGAPIVTIPASFCLHLHYPLKIAEEVYWNRNRLDAYFKNGLR